MRLLRFPEMQDVVIEALVEDLSAIQIAEFIVQLLKFCNSKHATQLTISLLTDNERQKSNEPK